MTLCDFKGKHDSTLDDKGRIRIPSKYISLLGEEFTVCYGDEKCLWAYPNEAWQQLTQILVSSNPFDRSTASFKRNIYPTAEDCKTDSVGRVLIPVDHRNYAGLKKDIMIIGAGDHIEFWDAEAWEKGDYTSLEKRQELSDKFAGGQN